MVKKFYVAQFLQLPYNYIDRYVSITNKWIVKNEPPNPIVHVAYPIEDPMCTKLRVIQELPYKNDWGTYQAIINYGSDKFDDIELWISRTNITESVDATNRAVKNNVSPNYGDGNIASERNNGVQENASSTIATTGNELRETHDRKSNNSSNMNQDKKTRPRSTLKRPLSTGSRKSNNRKHAKDVTPFEPDIIISDLTSKNRVLLGNGLNNSSRPKETCIDRIAYQNNALKITKKSPTQSSISHKRSPETNLLFWYNKIYNNTNGSRQFHQRSQEQTTKCLKEIPNPPSPSAPKNMQTISAQTQARSIKKNATSTVTIQSNVHKPHQASRQSHVNSESSQDQKGQVQYHNTIDNPPRDLSNIENLLSQSLTSPDLKNPQVQHSRSNKTYRFQSTPRKTPPASQNLSPNIEPYVLKDPLTSHFYLSTEPNPDDRPCVSSHTLSIPPSHQKVVRGSAILDTEYPNHHRKDHRQNGFIENKQNRLSPKTVQPSCSTGIGGNRCSPISFISSHQLPKPQPEIPCNNYQNINIIDLSREESTEEMCVDTSSNHHKNGTKKFQSLVNGLPISKENKDLIYSIMALSSEYDSSLDSTSTSYDLNKYFKINNELNDGINNHFNSRKTKTITSGPKGNNKVKSSGRRSKYNSNDTRWTLKHQKASPGVVEITPGSQIYIDAANFEICKRESSDCKKLARNLFVEIFSTNALNVCSLVGAKNKAFQNTKPTLDKHALCTLIHFVLDYGDRHAWPICNAQDIKKTLSYKIQYVKDKNNVRS